MKKTFLLIAILISFFVRGQTPQVSYVVQTIAQMKAYYGKANRIHVTATNQDFVECPSCVPDEVCCIYAGVGARVWKKVTDAEELLLKANLASPTLTGIPSAPTAALATNTNQIATTAFVLANTTTETALNKKKRSNINIINQLGGNLKAEPPATDIFSVRALGAQTAARMLFTLVDVLETGTITGVQWWMGVSGAYTASDYNGFGLYELNESTGGLTLIASTTSDGDIFKATTLTWQQKAFTSPIFLTQGESYYVAFLWNVSAATISPSIGINTNMQSANITLFNLPNSIKISGILAAQTSLPSTVAMSAITAIHTMPGFYLY